MIILFLSKVRVTGLLTTLVSVTGSHMSPNPDDPNSSGSRRNSKVNRLALFSLFQFSFKLKLSLKLQQKRK